MTKYNVKFGFFYKYFLCSLEVLPLTFDVLLSCSQFYCVKVKIFKLGFSLSISTDFTKLNFNRSWVEF